MNLRRFARSAIVSATIAVSAIVGAKAMAASPAVLDKTVENKVYVRTYQPTNATAATWTNDQFPHTLNFADIVSASTATDVVVSITMTRNYDVGSGVITQVHTLASVNYTGQFRRVVFTNAMTLTGDIISATVTNGGTAVNHSVVTYGTRN